MNISFYIYIYIYIYILHSLHRIQDDNYGNGVGSTMIKFKVKDMEMELVQKKEKGGEVYVAPFCLNYFVSVGGGVMIVLQVLALL